MILKNKKGQSLMEVMVAIGIITTGLFSVWALFLSNFSGEQEARSRIIAVNLGREGVEAIKNIRDSNWLRIDNGDDIDWNHGLDGDGTAIVINLLSGPIILDYGIDTPINSLDDGRTKLYLNDGFYTHSSLGRPTAYRRLIFLTPLCCADAGPSDLQCDDYDISSVCGEAEMTVGYKVESKVRWEVNDNIRELVVEDELYNWR